jgi:alkanesulfonate monooxygenase SsuD/methylene tetrahydromethanopterin reductase-like flavin-dependent oxidoreductase (luciferase family)
LKIDITPNGDSDSLRITAAAARQAERGGADGIAYPERSADAMQLVTLAAAATSQVALMTSVVVAFARSPMTLAAQAWSVQQLSQGRFILGLGSQVRAHVERRFSMPWGAPLARMADFVGALRAIWRCWQDGEPLDYQGEFYRHTLMPPMFTPEGRWPAPPVMLAVLGPGMTELAGGVADGVMIHPFTTPDYLAGQLRPALGRGLAARDSAARDSAARDSAARDSAARDSAPRDNAARESAGRDQAARGRFAVCGAPLVATGRTPEALAASVAGLRSRLAFYGSTPAYRRVLETHGWGDLGMRLHQLSTSSGRGKWAEMAALVPGEMLERLAVIGEPATAAAELARRYGGLLDRCQPTMLGPSSLAEQLQFTVLVRQALIKDAAARRPAALTTTQAT